MLRHFQTSVDGPSNHHVHRQSLSVKAARSPQEPLAESQNLAPPVLVLCLAHLAILEIPLGDQILAIPQVGIQKLLSVALATNADLATMAEEDRHHHP
jgi:hypothetical protein